MERQFRVDRCPSITTQESYDSPPVLDPSRKAPPWQFVIEVQQFLGADSDPDPLFFVESWSIGVPAAVESFRQRRQEQADQELHGRAFNHHCDLRALSFMQGRELNAEFHSSARAAAVAGCHDVGCPPHSPEWSSACAPDPAPRECETSAEECDSTQNTTRPMTEHGACQLLGVTATSTRGEIKAAYRHTASQWHPDRLGSRTEEERQLATEKMVQINAAYRLLRSGMRQKSI